MRTPPASQSRQISERTLVFLVAAVQFINILDFMMVMPLGPDFAAALGIPTSHIGVIGGSYTAAAAFSGVVGSLFLDRFDRRKVLGAAMFGLVAATALGGFAVGLESLLATRVLAGLFGGPATSISLAVIADVVPHERRGKAIGAVMSAFAAASVLGVPAGLELATLAGWRAPFFAVAALGLCVTTLAIFVMPPMRGHLRTAAQRGMERKAPLFDRLTLLALTNTALVMLGVFAIVPNLSAYLQHNLGYPRERLGVLYLVGGLASFAASRVVGGLVDRFGATRMVTLGTFVFSGAVYAAFIDPRTGLPVLVVFGLFMVSATARGVPLNTLASRVARPDQRAGFMSAQSATQHLASAVGAMGASALLHAEPDGRLIGMDRVAMVALILAAFVPLVAFVVESRVRDREKHAQSTVGRAGPSGSGPPA